MYLALLRTAFGRTPEESIQPPTESGQATPAEMTSQDRIRALAAVLGTAAQNVAGQQPAQPDDIDPNAALLGRLETLERDRGMDLMVKEIQASNEHVTEKQANDWARALTEGEFGKAWSISDEAARAKQEAEQTERDKELKNVHTEGPSRGDADLDNSPPGSLSDGIQQAIASYRR